MVVASTTQVASVSLLSSVSAPADAVISVCGWASSHGTLGLCAFAAVHTAAVVVCFPATILFELAAGFAFGVYQGAALAWSAKVTAALITFLASSGFARALLSNAGVEAAAERAFAAQPSLARLAQDVEQDGTLHPLVHHSLQAHHIASPCDTVPHLAQPDCSVLPRTSLTIPREPGGSALHAARPPLAHPLVAREPPPSNPPSAPPSAPPPWGPLLSPAAAHVPRRVHTVRMPCQNDHGLANPDPDPT